MTVGTRQDLTHVLDLAPDMGAVGSPIVHFRGVLILSGRDLFSLMPVVRAGGFGIVVDLLVEGSFIKYILALHFM